MNEMCFLVNLRVWNFKHVYGSYVTGLVILKISDFTLNAAMGWWNASSEMQYLTDEMLAEQT